MTYQRMRAVCSCGSRKYLHHCPNAPRMIDALDPEPVVRVSKSSVQRRQVLDLVRQHPGLRARNIGKRLGMTTEQVYQRVAWLRRAGQVESARKSRSKGRRRGTYWPTDAR